MQVDVELYRSDVRVQDKPPVALSVIEIAPEQPKRTMLFIHGFGGQASQWARQLSHFSREARVIAYDLRGHGQSDKPNSQYTMEEIQHDLETLVARLRLPERFILLSHSFGGAIAAQYAANHPERLERLVLIGTASEFRLNRWAQLPFKLPAAWLAPLWRVARRTLSAPPHVAKTLYHNALTAWNGATVFPKIQTLTLVVTGYRDRLFPTAAFEDVPALIPGAQQIKVPVSAHMVMIERAEAVNRAIERFLVEPTASQVGQPAARISARPMSSTRGRYPTRPWLRFYDEGVPYTVSLPERPLFRFLERAARR
ncbi:MAG: alpha/beta hydrolase, partial [Anaerolineae bacterium]